MVTLHVCADVEICNTIKQKVHAACGLKRVLPTTTAEDKFISLTVNSCK